MQRRIDWAAKTRYAKGLPTAWLKYAIDDCMECVRIWNAQRDADYDGNASYYSDEASIYAAELARRRR